MNYINLQLLNSANEIGIEHIPKYFMLHYTAEPKTSVL